MKQILQELRTGRLLVQDVAAPAVKPGHLLIRTTRSLISAGTERMLSDFAKASYIGKARQQPDKVKQVLDKARTDGFIATYEAVNSKLAQPIPLGYCNVGRVLQIGDGVEGFEVGDRVASNRPHAEIVLAPKNLCAAIPDKVDDEQAAFVVVSAIALQGIRLVAPTLGETIVVSGLGLIGLLAVQILKANGCAVIGFDFNSDRVARARSYGAEAYDLSDGLDPVATVLQSTLGVGADGILITASTAENSVIVQSAQMSRKRGRIVLTGVVGLNLQRNDFYEKELSFQVSCSYGPGRYDAGYETRGHDYPLAFVRWTEKRNFEAVLRLMKDRRLDVDGLITDRIAFAQAPEAYALLGSSKPIGVVLEYSNPVKDALLTSRTLTLPVGVDSGSGKAIAIFGAGAFVQSRVLPGLRKAGANIKTIVSSNGMSGAIAARNFHIPVVSTDDQSALADSTIGGVVIATPHNSHARLVIDAIRAGKHVFVEKPICISDDELNNILATREECVRKHGRVPAIMVGFNRRYAPLSVRVRKMMATRIGPAFAIFTVNAGALPPEHWARDPKVGGGRIIGEGCHFVDFLQFLIGSRIASVQAMKQGTRSSDHEDNATISLAFEDGSIGQINYFSIGNRGFGKERCVVSFDGKTAVLDNFRSVAGYGLAGSKRAIRQDKGHDVEFASFVRLVNGSIAELPVDFEIVENVMRATFAAVESMRIGTVVSLA